MRARGALLGVAAATLVAAVPARAATVTYAFAGVVTTLTSDGGLFGAPGSVDAGDPFTGHASWEVGLGNPDQSPADAELGAYDLIELVIDQSVLPALEPNGIRLVHDTPDPTLPPNPPDPGRDWFFARSLSDAYSSVLLRLQGPFGSAFTDDSLPETLALADFPDVAVIQGLVATGIPPNPSIEDVGTITSLWRVPEPGSAGAALAALGALLGISRATRRPRARADRGRRRPASARCRRSSRGR